MMSILRVNQINRCDSCYTRPAGAATTRTTGAPGTNGRIRPTRTTDHVARPELRARRYNLYNGAYFSRR
jgi:hypothetical protein